LAPGISNLGDCLPIEDAFLQFKYHELAIVIDAQKVERTPCSRSLAPNQAQVRHEQTGRLNQQFFQFGFGSITRCSRDRLHINLARIISANRPQFDLFHNIPPAVSITLHPELQFLTSNDDEHAVVAPCYTAAFG
jgi:hypothetical protein